METPPPSLPSQAPAKPRALLVFGIISILLGLFGLMGMVTSLLSLVSPAASAGNPAMQAMMADPTISTFTKVGLVPGLLAAIGQIAAGIGLIKAKEWARKLIIGISAYSILAAGVGAYMSIVHISPIIGPLMAKTLKDENVAKIMQVTTTVSALLGLVFSIAYSVTLTIMLMRAKVRVYCIAASGKPGPLIAG